MDFNAYFDPLLRWEYLVKNRQMLTLGFNKHMLQLWMSYYVTKLPSMLSKVVPARNPVAVLSWCRNK
jgi:hypothetical protein